MDEKRAAEVTPRQWHAMYVSSVIAAVALASLSIAYLAWFASDTGEGIRLVFGIALAVPATAAAYIAVRSGART